MAEQGEKISREYVIPELDLVTSEFNSEFTDTGIAPTSDDILSFREKYLEAIAKGIDDYVTNEFYYDVKTNGTVVIATTPPGTFPIVDYAVDGTFITDGKDTLKDLFMSNLTSGVSGAVENMEKIFNSILSWLPTSSPNVVVNGSITDTSVNPIIYLSTVAGPPTPGIPTVTWENFNVHELASSCVDETKNLIFVDENGNQTGKNYKDVWDIIGKYIYDGLEGNVANFSPVVGTADPTKITNGTTYTATTTIGTIGFN